MKRRFTGVWIYIFAIMVTAAVFAGTTHFTNISTEDLAVTDDLTVTDDATIGGNLAVTGTTALTGNATAAGTLGVTGNTTIGGTLAVTGTQTFTGNTTCSGTLSVTGAQTFTGNTTCSGDLGVTGVGTFGDDVDVTGGVTVSDIFYETKLIYQTDFMEAANALASTTITKAYWTGGGTNGTQTVTAGVNGDLVMSTTATGSSTSTFTFSTANFATNNGPMLESRFNLDNITNTKMNFGWYVDANNYLMIEFDTDDDAGNIYVVSNNAGAGEVATDTTVDLVAGTDITVRIEIDTDETFAVSINGTDVAEAHAGTIPELATYKPYFYVNNKAAAEEKKLSIDYVKIWQNR